MGDVGCCWLIGCCLLIAGVDGRSIVGCFIFTGDLAVSMRTSFDIVFGSLHFLLIYFDVWIEANGSQTKGSRLEWGGFFGDDIYI